jgi:ubiquitin-conjugating enzyme E2 O
VYENTTEAALNSRLYSEKAYILARGFVSHVLTSPVPGLEDVVGWLYRGEPGMLKRVVEKARGVVERSEGGGNGTGSEGGGSGGVAEETSDGVGKLSRGALVMLRRTLKVLEGLLEQ